MSIDEKALEKACLVGSAWNTGSDIIRDAIEAYEAAKCADQPVLSELEIVNRALLNMGGQPGRKPIYEDPSKEQPDEAWPFIRQTDNTIQQGSHRDYRVRRTTYWSKGDNGEPCTVVLQIIKCVAPSQMPLQVSKTIKVYRGNLRLEDYAEDEMALRTEGAPEREISKDEIDSIAGEVANAIQDVEVLSPTYDANHFTISWSEAKEMADALIKRFDIRRRAVPLSKIEDQEGA